MDSNTIRNKFLEFFRNKGHQIVPSAPMVLKDDPTLMFTNAGMNQFKDYFLGNQVPKYKRIADTQKCLRVSGKHNDLEEVGMDTYHHTMFEMLGNWSFGDYFKKEAIAWGWELLTKEYKLPAERLYVTVFGGSKEDKLDVDQEAYDLWSDITDKEKILFGDKKDNFWEMGDTGPCGPCSEIHIDLRPEEERQKKEGSLLVNQDHPLVVEIWNLVFIQYNRMASGTLQPLPEKHVDTGMGFERLCMAIQNKTSNYDTDVFQPIIQLIGKEAKVTYGDKKETDVAIRVMADHIRAIAFAVADGQLPSNNKAGYVIRRILRRAVRYGFTFLNFNEPFLYKLVPMLSAQTAEIFPELKQQEEFIMKVIQEEEASFLKTLETGLKKLEQIKTELNKKGAKLIPGEVVFELYDTFGFPVDLTALIARENSLSIDQQGFEQAMEQQKSRSRKAAEQDKGDWKIVQVGDEVSFVGYQQMEAKAHILRYRHVKEKKNSYYQLVLDVTPFYAESGGQVGDTGYLEVDGKKYPIFDTKKENELIIHFIKEIPADPQMEVKAVINQKKRALTMNNHSATHLLHAALREVLGDHVQQRGSMVNDKILRFDFSHFAKMTEEEIERVERRVNQKVRDNIKLEERQNIPLAEAKEMGATALFGEKYGEFVRVIVFDPEYSIELCGGTHIPATGSIGLFKVVGESSVAAGVRRIEAVTAEAAEEIVRQQEDTLKQLNDLLKHPKDIIKSINGLVEDKNKLSKELEQLQMSKAADLKNDLLKAAKEKGGIQYIIEKVALPSADALKKIAFDLKNELNNLVMVLAADIDGKPQIAVVIAENLVKEKELHAGNLARELAKEIKGGGGGQPFFATAGGSDLSGLDKVIEMANQKFMQ